jgi:uncharacterized protein (TIGR02246 family)
MKKRWILAPLMCLSLVTLLGPVVAPGRATLGPEDSARRDDEQAIRSATESFIKDFESGDAKALVSHWTENGEYIGDDGTVISGRAALAKAYGERTAEKGKAKVDNRVDAVRFPSRDTAVEEGRFTVRRDKDTRISSRYTIMFAREDGKWLIASLRELADESLSLDDLSWLIGTWEAKRGDSDVQTTYEWWGKKAFIRVKFTIKTKDDTATGYQMITSDASSGQLRSWTFEEGGGFGEAVWDRDGRKWLIAATGVIADGSSVTATNIITPIDANTFTWQSVERTDDGEEEPDIAPVKVTRVVK